MLFSMVWREYVLNNAKIANRLVKSALFKVETKATRRYNSWWSPFVSISLLAVGWVTGAVNEKYTEFLWSYHSDKCYAIKPCTLSKGNTRPLSFKNSNLIQCVTLVGKHIYSSALQWIILFYYAVEERGPLFKNLANKHSSTWNGFGKLEAFTICTWVTVWFSQGLLKLKTQM